ncbi:hypothetical protein ACWOAQ_00375 [Helcococcus kunzii]|uniref:Uncharacterized protein n=1 Tax=Helcococcus kunzii ATCC 51366 TaxID=883114 RepID=H3NPY4_9FIRM|nr:hypothetical protein [Helcococcus kunzii]EHR33206.1 hypothetical protein HMPREF9709_01250 [Helcococcus kunzii ATCC 51366]MCT1795861.1 hypothetical protein [Helcococcus kunzii]MCT1988587.1 hypothetical protein [Helcococcus kunzii]QZO75809.1 hypothetical protein HIF96_05865 [Helcococcus kunzii]
MGILKGIFDEIKSELNNEIEKAKNTSSSSKKDNLEQIQNMLFGTSSAKYTKHHRDNQGVLRPQPKKSVNKPQTSNQQKLRDLKAKRYEEKKKSFNQSFESKYVNSKNSNGSIKNKKTLIGEEGEGATIYTNDLSKMQMSTNQIIRIDAVNPIAGSANTRKVSKIGKQIINPENAKKAFIASVIFERKKWR